MDTHKKLSWGAIIAGALLTAALFLIFVTFGLALGLAVGSPAPTWRDSSFVVWFASGLYLILTAVVSSAAGAYMAGRMHPHAPDPDLEENELRSGLHGLTVWALAVVMGALLATAGARTLSPMVSPAGGGTGQASSLGGENLLAYELDRLFRSERRSPEGDLQYERSEAGRVLLMTNSRTGVLPDDRAHLARLVAARSGLSGPDAQARVDAVIVRSRDALDRARKTGVLMGFMTATALLLGAAVSWFAAQRGERDAYGDEISSADSMFRASGPQSWFSPPRRRVIITERVDRT